MILVALVLAVLAIITVLVTGSFAVLGFGLAALGGIALIGAAVGVLFLQSAFVGRQDRQSITAALFFGIFGGVVLYICYLNAPVSIVLTGAAG